MALRLKINRKLDDKLLQQFQNDPYADLNVRLQQTNLQLSAAYLSLDSQRISELSPQQTTIDLTQFEQTATVAVLRALYGAPLEVSSVADFENVWPVIRYLQIEEYEKAAQQQIKNWLQKRDGAPGSLQWVQACLKHGLLREWIVVWLSSQHLKTLQTTKNYLQLGKLSDESLNYILLEYVKREEAKTAVVNTILENYFNRKGHSPLQYLQNPDLGLLKKVWELHHHKLRPTKIQKITSIHNLVATTVTSPPAREERTSGTEGKKGISSYNCVSVQLTSQAFRQEKMSDPYMLDIKLSVLANELDQKNKRIRQLKQELQQLQELKVKKENEGQNINQESLFDIALLKSRMKSKREKQLNQETNSEYALDSPCKRVLEQEQRTKGLSKGTSEKKI